MVLHGRHVDTPELCVVAHPRRVSRERKSEGQLWRLPR